MLAAGAVFAIYDLVQIDNAVARVNKRLRILVYLSQTAGAPQGFKGHYTDDHPQAEEQEQPSHDPGPTANASLGSRAASFSEQEQRLRELSKLRPKNGG